MRMGLQWVPFSTSRSPELVLLRRNDDTGLPGRTKNGRNINWFQCVEIHDAALVPEITVAAIITTGFPSCDVDRQRGEGFRGIYMD